MALETEIYKLKKASMFWDPTQSVLENQKIVGKQVKRLERTSRVSAALNGAIQVATEKELEAYEASLKPAKAPKEKEK